MLNEDLIYEGKVVGTYSGDGSVDLLGTAGIIGMSDYWIPRLSLIHISEPTRPY